MSTIEPCYFGPPGRQLFGVYHPPLERPRAAGVLLCYPAPQEYMRCHWAFRKLAALLARTGLHVLRFDYFGSGDSCGETHAGSLAQWRRDVALAFEELRALSGATRFSLVGLHLGAALAAQASVRVRDLVLWEPVVSGREHIAELHAQHARLFAHCLHPPPACGELLGLPWPAAVREEFEGLALEPPFACRAERIVVLGAAERPAYRGLLERLRAAQASGGPAVEWHQVEETVAASEENFLLSARTQQAITALLAGTPVSVP